MKPLEIAARYAAFAWYINYRQAPSRTTQAEAQRFSNENWEAFLSVAHEGWGRLLLRVAKAKPNGSAAARKPTERQMAAAG